ncbi:uncharacterized protein si:dkey-181m9.8 isoform X3 [Callorhinchus milii]|uniref:uncharacterized protein si:dkey-181m9.8 isoform X3 n=1 Tax=Callorhinchus milii TaxID=7868 RepID=UPI001C3FE60D|nr:uncharacterized protein si:dkey-181m9.8 isoform X3 [Callorhinchus milii]
MGEASPGSRYGLEAIMTAAAAAVGLESSLRECSYVYPARIIKEFESVQATYRDLIVDFDLFSYGNGVKKKLVRLRGTIPVTCKGRVRKISVCIWLHTLHPDMMPKCFVWLLTNKGITGNWVDINDMMTSQYLNNWKSSTSHLVGLLEDIRISFGERVPPPMQFAASQKQITIPQAFSNYEQQSDDSFPAGWTSNYAEARQLLSRSTLLGTGTRNNERHVSGETPLPTGQHAARKTKKKSYITELMSLDLSFSEVPVLFPLQQAGPKVEIKMDPVEQTTDLLGNLNLDAILNAYNMKTSLNKPDGARAMFSSDQIGSGGGEHIKNLWNTQMLNSSKNNRKVQVLKIPAGFSAHRIKDKVTIHFQRSKNGGGEIVHLQYPTRIPGRAVITFVDAQVAERVVQQEWHTITIDGKDVCMQLKPYNARDDITDLAGGANAVLVRSEDTLWTHNPPMSLLSTPAGVSQDKSSLFQSLVNLEDQNFNVEDVIEAVKSSLDYDSALRFLSHECPICSDNVSFNKIVMMTHCSCSFCEACFKNYFSSTIKEKSILNLVCPMCSAPDLNNRELHEDITEYFNLLDTQIRYYLDYEIHELFQRKLRDRTLMEMPNFRWCANCSFGLLHELDQLRMDCPSCKKSTCFQCKSPWEPQHEGISCESFKKWKQQNNPEYQATQLDTYLTKNGIDLWILEELPCKGTTCTPSPKLLLSPQRLECTTITTTTKYKWYFCLHNP